MEVLGGWPLDPAKQIRGEVPAVVAAKFLLGKAKELFLAKFWQGKVCHKLGTWHQEAWELVVAKLRPSSEVHEDAEVVRPHQAFLGARKAATNPQ